MSSKAEDLDETRRLLYTALAVGQRPGESSLHEHATLAGTLANALAHHQGRYEDPMEALEFAVGVVRGVKAHTNGAWQYIRRITSEIVNLTTEAAE